MPPKPARPCTTPGCSLPAADGGRCPNCRARRTRQSDARRGTASARGYGPRWAARRIDYLRRRPWCALCGKVATVPDHYPTSRRDLVAAGVDDPDADDRLRPLCDLCHRRETARHQPGGWHRAQAPPPTG